MELNVKYFILYLTAKKNQNENDIKDWSLFDIVRTYNVNITEILTNIVPWDMLNQIDKNEL